MELQFLLIDDNRDGDSRIIRALLQRFPEAKVTEFSSFAASREILESLPPETPDCVIIAGRVRELSLVPLVRAVRECQALLPVIAMGEAGLEADAIGAGASRFLDYDAWLMLAPTVRRLVGIRRATDTWS